MESECRLWWVDYQSQRSIKLDCAPDFLKIGVSARDRKEALSNAESKLISLGLRSEDWKYIGGCINPPTPTEWEKVKRGG